MHFRTTITVVLMAAGVARADHPEVLVTPADRDAIVSKIHDNSWAQAKYDKIKSQVDQYVQQSHDDPSWLSSRLAMNWQTHYQTPVCEKSRYVGGEGHAPVPTPRFAGARDWATQWSAPPDLQNLRVRDDNAHGQLFLHNSATGQDAWVDPGITGRTIESINQRIMQAAADASFVYWITGDEKYARFASDALWTYMQGYAYVTPPKLPPGDRSMAPIIGITSFEVIHEDIVTPLSISYDFLHDYLARQGKDVTVIQSGLKRMIDRVIAGGSREGNWNLNQARIITYGALALEDDDAYTDHQGRSYYVDVVLNADLPNQLGITRVIHHALDPKTALWPEAPGYGFGAAKDITLIASLLDNTPAGQAVLSDPILPRNVLAQANLCYPNGFAVGLGDTTNTRVNAEQIELMIAAARHRGQSTTEAQLSTILQHEIDSGNYDRATAPDDLVAITKFVNRLNPTTSGPPPLVRSYFGQPLNVLLQRILTTDPDTSLAAAMYGTGGGHVHANGLAIELYGAGMTMAADPGRGDSYWTRNHAEYYSQPPAHNTVIVNGLSDYNVAPATQIGMTLQLTEPAPSSPADPSPSLCPNIGFAQSSFEYQKPAAEQQRTLALVQPIAGGSGFYFDVIRSRANGSAESGQFHDYLYHNIGSLQSLTDQAGQPLQMTASDQLDPQGKFLRGYTYFTNVRSAPANDSWRARFAITEHDLSRMMDLWMPGQPGRTLFSVDAPANHEDRGALSHQHMPTIIVRQQGRAWDRPFIAVYEPSTAKEQSTIKSVQTPSLSPADRGLAAVVVEGYDDAFTVLLLQDDQPQRSHDLNEVKFQGSFAAVINHGSAPPQLYLGSGHILSNGIENITAASATPLSATLWPEGAGWRYSASAPVSVTIPFSPSPTIAVAGDMKLLRGEGTTAKAYDAQLRHAKDAAGREILLATVALPTGYDQPLHLREAAAR